MTAGQKFPRLAARGRSGALPLRRMATKNGRFGSNVHMIRNGQLAVW